MLFTKQSSKGFRVSICWLIVTLLLGCVSNTANKAPEMPLYKRMRIQYFEANPDVNNDTKVLISQQKTFQGMAPGELRLSWGEPDYKSILKNESIAIWSYETKYKIPYKFIFRDNKLVEKVLTKKSPFVKFGTKKQVPVQSRAYGWKNTLQAESNAILSRDIGHAVDRWAFTKNRFKTIRDFNDEFKKRGIDVRIDEEKDRAILTPLSVLSESKSTPMDFEDLVPGLPENTVYLDISAKALAGFLAGYQMHYNAKCKFKSANGELKESEITLNWNHSSIKKPDVFKTVICERIVQDESGLMTSFDVKNTFKKVTGKKAYIVTSYFDCEPGKTYKLESTIRNPDGKIFLVGKEGGLSLKASSNRIQNIVTLNIDQLSEGKHQVTAYINSFMTGSVDIEVTE